MGSSVRSDFVEQELENSGCGKMNSGCGQQWTKKPLASGEEVSLENLQQRHYLEQARCSIVGVKEVVGIEGCRRDTLGAVAAEELEKQPG